MNSLVSAKKAPTLSQKKSADPPHSDTGLLQPTILYGEVCTYGCNFNEYSFALHSLIEVAVRVRN